MMLGSLLYTTICTYSLPSTPSAPQDSSLTLHAKLSSLVCAVSSLALAISIRSASEQVRFWAFCAFEMCVGMYYPVQGMLRGSLISNEHRATVSSVTFLRSGCSLVISAILVIPSATKYIRGRIAVNRRRFCTKSNHCGKRSHARLFVHYDGNHDCKPRRPGACAWRWDHKAGLIDNILFAGLSRTFYYLWLYIIQSL